VSEDFFQAAVRELALRHAFQPEVLQPRPHLLGGQVLSHGQHLHSLLAGGQRRDFCVEPCGVDIVPCFFLLEIAFRVRVQQQQRIFFSFFCFLFFFLFIRRGYGGNITFSCCFSFLFFLFFLNSGLVVRLLVTFCARFDGERIVIPIFTNGYDCSFVGRLLVNYVAVNHFIDAAAQPTAVKSVLLSVVIHAHLHAPPLVRFHKQEREEVPAPRVLEDPGCKGFAVKVNVIAHNFNYQRQQWQGLLSPLLRTPQRGRSGSSASRTPRGPSRRRC